MLGLRRNLGTVERSIRLLLALALGVVLVQRAAWGWLEWTLALAALFLVLNALSGRCYLWRWLGLNSAKTESETCELSKPQEDASID
jgi:hypothetical protein